MAHAIPTNSQPTAAPRHLLELPGAGDMAAFYAAARALYGRHDRDDVVVRIVDHMDHRAGVIGFHTGSLLSVLAAAAIRTGARS